MGIATRLRLEGEYVKIPEVPRWRAECAGLTLVEEALDGALAERAWSRLGRNRAGAARRRLGGGYRHGSPMPKLRVTEIDRFDGALPLVYENPLDQPVGSGICLPQYA